MEARERVGSFELGQEVVEKGREGEERIEGEKKPEGKRKLP